MKVKLLFESDCHSHNEGIVIFLKYLIEKKYLNFDLEYVTEKKNGEISDKYGIFIILDKINEQDLTFECSDTEYIQIIKEFSDSHWSKIARGIEQEFECLWRNDTMQIIIGI